MLSLSAKMCARQKTEFRDCFYFLQDLEYWNVDELYLEQCCVQKYYQQRELLTWDMGTTKKEDELEIFRAGRLGRLQKILWDLFERPHTSIGARVMIYYYLDFFIIIKTIPQILLFFNFGKQCVRATSM